MASSQCDAVLEQSWLAGSIAVSGDTVFTICQRHAFNKECRGAVLHRTSPLSSSPMGSDQGDSRGAPVSLRA
jgi:hypothetical protein